MSDNMIFAYAGDVLLVGDVVSLVQENVVNRYDHNSPLVPIGVVAQFPGLRMNGYMEGDVVPILVQGKFRGILEHGVTVGESVYIGTSGGPAPKSKVLPGHVICLGVATSETDFELRIQYIGRS